ncbi:uncharacterized protein Z520_06150 [Fonsecaea multimorphosa CBS 102226]|uniref:F-box domain-containing protein n=1 Tax=Fonsecaea multimorphosa CBS 102226 TaxID=1442371 RepID=A0A0D2H880_9EURO|nr:uncharacterized protein Z520_06150 [Fonsecaea multimorphosa CBS 102226]KIX98070.1 hypothetical protein Z520_06150 [Fonsecaea multimorphosa CBS 102226]
MAQPSEYNGPLKNRLSSLPGELQLHIAKHLDYSDLGRARGASRALSRCFADPAARLADEMSRAFFEFGNNFQDRYYVGANMLLLGKTIRGRSIQQQVWEHAMACGFSTTLCRWLVHPDHFHFPCSKCRVVRPWVEFPSDSLRRMYPFYPFRPYDGGPLETQRDYKGLLDPMPHECHYLGMNRRMSSIIQCRRCLTIKRGPGSPSFRLRFSGLCQHCYEVVHQDWFTYKNFLQDCVATMDAYEKGELLTWRGLPGCSVPAHFIAALNTPYYRPLPAYSPFIFDQPYFRAAGAQLQERAQR